MDASPLLQALPAPLRAIARDSLGGAAALAAQFGPQGHAILNLAQNAFVQAIGPTVLFGAIFSFSGALVAFLFVPHRIAKLSEQTETIQQDQAVPVPVTSEMAVSSEVEVL